ncbi:MAG: hypothetical protein Q9207_001748 [Kuettlingeria erythrocarpa]
MPLLFSSLCKLLEALEDNAISTKKALKGWLDQRNRDTIESWVKSYKVTIDSTEVDVVVLLSAIFPEKRTDRVYSLQPARLSKILGRCFRLGRERLKILDEWNTPGRGGLAVCVERVVRQTEHQEAVNPVTLEEIDNTLLAIASKNRFSAPGVREAVKEDGVETYRPLNSIYLRLNSCEAKWFTRMILKDFSPLAIKSYHVFNAVDKGLVQALNVHSTFEAAVGLLRHRATTTGHDSSPRSALKPVVGHKVGRVPYLKGRSIKNVVHLAEGRKMSVERKYDGEYCQIHIDLAKTKDCIQIFSKSGKDSTVDRRGLHDAIKQSLRIGNSDRKFRQKCILEGEMVVYSDKDNKVLEFHKIRKHVSRSGSWLGTEFDSQAHQYEHLMISYYDVMMIDDDLLMNEPHARRRNRLEQLVTCVRGRANLTKHKTLDFSSRSAPENLRRLLANAFAQRWEGLVLKPSNEPYFSKNKTSEGLPAHCWIKLKKDYIPGLGDTADFAVVGAGYDARRAAQLQCPSLKLPSLKWTHFHIACLRNKEQVATKNAKPCFKILLALEVNLDMTKHLNQHGQYCASPFGSILSHQDPFMLEVTPGMHKMDVVFRKPFVFDVMGAGFEKEANQDYFTIRFPRVLKVHSDRDWKASTGFDELQQMAKIARTVPEDTKHCVADWMKQLEQVDRGAKGSAVPWDLSDDEVETPQAAGPSLCTEKSTSRRTVWQSSAAPPFIRMDTQEMTAGEQRLDSGEVVQRPTSQRSHMTAWSQSTLPTPPRTSQPRETSTTPTRRALSSIDSTNSTSRQRKRSIEDERDSWLNVTAKRRRVSPPARMTKKEAGLDASTRASANIKPPQRVNISHHVPAPPSPADLPRRSGQRSPSTSFLVRKLSTGAAEAINSRAQPRIHKEMEPTSPDRQTTDNEQSSQGSQSSQQSLVAQWQLQPAKPSTPYQIRLPDLDESCIVLSPDISNTPYLTEDILGAAQLESKTAYEIFNGGGAVSVSPLVSSSPDDDDIKDFVFLIEGRRHDPSLEMLKFLVGRVPSDGVFWVFDWRLLEDMYARDVKDDARLIKKRMLGRFWHEEEGLMWLNEHGDVCAVAKEKLEESMRMEGAFLKG